MVVIDIPGFGELRLEHLVLDFNGTLAEHGVLIPGVAVVLHDLAHLMQIHVVTADTFGTVTQQLAHAPVKVIVLDEVGQAKAKRDYVIGLGAKAVVAIGNGRNDELMLKSARIGIAVVQAEGAAHAAFQAADVVCSDILIALDLLKYPVRLAATLRA